MLIDMYKTRLSEYEQMLLSLIVQQDWEEKYYKLLQCVMNYGEDRGLIEFKNSL